MKVLLGTVVLVVGFLAITWTAIGQHVFALGMAAINGLGLPALGGM